MATMRVAQVPSPGAPFEIVERPVPEPGPGTVRIKVEACGICHSDMFTKLGLFPGTVYPRVPGHEAVGVIDAVGEGVTHLSPGQRAGVGWNGGYCSACDPCRGEVSATVSAPREAMAAKQSGASAPEPWADLVNAGLAFLGQLGQAAAGGDGAGKKAPGLAGFIKQNERTGAPELQIPLPDPETAAKLGVLLGGLGDVLKALGARK